MAKLSILLTALTAILLPLPGTSQVLINLTATQPSASEQGLVPGNIRLSREADDVSSSLTVALAVTGTADCLGGTDCDFDPTWESASNGRYRWTIPGGQEFLDIAVQPLADNLFEGPETLTLSVLDSGAYDPGPETEATVTIIDDAALVSVLAADPNASENGPDTGRFEIRRSGGDLASPLTVALGISGSADCISGLDCAFDPPWVLAGGGRFRWEIPADATNLEILVEPAFDESLEGDETVVFTVLTSSTYQVDSDNEASVVIADFVETIFADGFEANTLEAGSKAMASAFCAADTLIEADPMRYLDLGATVVDLRLGVQWLRCGVAAYYDWTVGACIVDPFALKFIVDNPGLDLTAQINSGRLGDNAGFTDWHLPKHEIPASVHGCLARVGPM